MTPTPADPTHHDHRAVTTPLGIRSFGLRHRPGCTGSPLDPFTCSCDPYTTTVWSSLAWILPGRCIDTNAPDRPPTAHTAPDPTTPHQLDLFEVTS